MPSPRLALVTIHVESHPKYSDFCSSQFGFVKWLHGADYPPLCLHWLREKDDDRDFGPTLRSISSRHEVGLHFHTVMDVPGPQELVLKLAKEKRILEAALGRPVFSFSSGHFGMTAHAPRALLQNGLHVDCSVAPGSVMVSAKSNSCAYRQDLPSLFWWETPNGERVLEIPITTSGGGILDAAASRPRDVLKMIDLSLDQPLPLVHLTTHSYNFLSRSGAPGPGEKIHRVLFDLLEKLGFIFITTQEIAEHVDIDRLPVFSAEGVFHEV